VAMAYILIGAAVLRGRRTATAALIVLNIGLAAATTRFGGSRVWRRNQAERRSRD
jgi:hypothetical protein